MELSCFTAEGAGINQNGGIDGVLALLQGLLFSFSHRQERCCSQLVVQLYLQASVPFLHSLGSMVSLSSPLGTVLTPRNHRVGRGSSCHSPGYLTPAGDPLTYLHWDFLHSSLGTYGFSLLAAQPSGPLSTDRSIFVLCRILSSPREVPGERWECVRASRGISHLALIGTSEPRTRGCIFSTTPAKPRSFLPSSICCLVGLNSHLLISVCLGRTS